jgi:hypothetical protein
VAHEGRTYGRLGQVVAEVRLARIAAGLHSRHSTLDGERLGRRVARHVTRHHFQPLCRPRGGGREDQAGGPGATADALVEQRRTCGGAGPPASGTGRAGPVR